MFHLKKTRPCPGVLLLSLDPLLCLKRKAKPSPLISQLSPWLSLSGHTRNWQKRANRQHAS